jgi:hypothetical protein
MARLARAEVFAPDEIAVVHVMNRVVRRCFLLGNDPVTGNNYDHRKTWIEEQLRRMATCFGIDLLCFSILSNHFHVILRSRPDVIARWDDTEVARRWLMLCPVRKDGEGLAEEPNEMELNSIRHDPHTLSMTLINKWNPTSPGWRIADMKPPNEVMVAKKSGCPFKCLPSGPCRATTAGKAARQSGS